MCLLESVLTWDGERIACVAINHRLPDHPLCQHGRLGAACGIEYAAQAMAIHGALVSDQDAPPRPGMLISVRAVDLHVNRLDDIPHDLVVEAERISGDLGLLLYQFKVCGADRCLLEGRASVLLDRGTTVPTNASFLHD